MCGWNLKQGFVCGKRLRGSECIYIVFQLKSFLRFYFQENMRFEVNFVLWVLCFFDIIFFFMIV